VMKMKMGLWVGNYFVKVTSSQKTHIQLILKSQENNAQTEQTAVPALILTHPVCCNSPSGVLEML
jgi:hypothetical protein